LLVEATANVVDPAAHERCDAKSSLRVAIVPSSLNV